MSAKNFFGFLEDSSSDFLGGIKHQWPYLSWNDIDVLSSPLFWAFIVLLFAGLFFAGPRTIRGMIPVLIVAGALSLILGGLIAAYTMTVIILAALALLRSNRSLAGGVLIMVLVGDFLLTLGYFLCRVDYNQMTSGPGSHKIPGELWEGMQNVFTFLMLYYIFSLNWGFYFYRTRPGNQLHNSSN